MKKTKTMAGVLAMTAGLAMPQASLAAKKVEPSFPKEFSLRSTQLIRAKDHRGQYSIGHLYMDLKQESLTPSMQNLLHGEMSGLFYFTSDKEDQSSTDGRTYNTFVSLAGEDGELILDLISKNAEGSQYQVYGCNSTMGVCSGTVFLVEFNKKDTNSVNIRIGNGGAPIEFWSEEYQQWVVGYDVELTKK